MVHVDGVRRQFGARVLFEGLSWMIPRGSRLGLVGPNGAGKTTLLRILAGSEAPDAGEVRRPAALRVGYLPQEVETVSGGSVLSCVLDGFPDLRRLEEEIESLESRLATLRPDDPALGQLAETYGVARQRFEHLGGDAVEARARAILGGLGIGAGSFHEPLETLSGGWRMRVLLARLLLAAPDLLLLDEPTNHLDLDALGWIERFLDGYEGAFVVVSHDRYFLNRMVQGVAELERGRLTTYAGAYDDYLDAKEARRAALEKLARRQDAEISRVERFVERFRYKATKARQVQARIRVLGKLERVQVERDQKRIRFGFPSSPRSGDVVARGVQVSKAFGSTEVYRDASFVLRRGDRLALVGPNGSGKSTLLKLLDGRIAPDTGVIEIGHNVAVQYYAQHQLEALDPSCTVLAELEKTAEPGSRPRLRSLLGAFLFSGEDVDKKVGILSGGEKARLALAKMLLRPANLLLLDEPTNHLDLRSREVLEEALNEYEGTLVIVSHDRYFINRVATMMGEVGGGRIEAYPGDFDTYLERQARLEAEDVGSPALPERAVARLKDQEARRAEAEDRNRRYRERRAVQDRLEPVEAEIGSLEARIRELAALQADPSVYRDPERARAAGKEKIDVEGRLGSLYEIWERIAAELPDD